MYIFTVPFSRQRISRNLHFPQPGIEPEEKANHSQCSFCPTLQPHAYKILEVKHRKLLDIISHQ